MCVIRTQTHTKLRYKRMEVNVAGREHLQLLQAAECLCACAAAALQQCFACAHKPRHRAATHHCKQTIVKKSMNKHRNKRLPILSVISNQVSFVVFLLVIGTFPENPKNKAKRQLTASAPCNYRFNTISTPLPNVTKKINLPLFEYYPSVLDN